MKSVQCRACGRPIVFLPTAGGRSIPVNVETVLPGETVFIPGKHVSHFSDCPAAEQFRKKKPEQEEPSLFSWDLVWEKRDDRDIAYSTDKKYCFIIQLSGNRLYRHLFAYIRHTTPEWVRFYPGVNKEPANFDSLYTAKEKAQEIATMLEIV